jgi:hypothetical protein
MTGMKHTGVAGKSLGDQARIFIDQYRHD